MSAVIASLEHAVRTLTDELRTELHNSRNTIKMYREAILANVEALKKLGSTTPIVDESLMTDSGPAITFIGHDNVQFKIPLKHEYEGRIYELQYIPLTPNINGNVRYKFDYKVEQHWLKTSDPDSGEVEAANTPLEFAGGIFYMGGFYR